MSCGFIIVFSRDPVIGESQKRAFYQVFVHDPNLINYVKKNLNKRDRIFVNGFLNYKSETGQDGKRFHSGYVEATNILKIDRFPELSNENPIDESIKTVNK